MDLPKEFLRQYVFTVAVNAGMMDEQLAAKIKAYDLEAFASILSLREKELEARSHDPGSMPFRVEPNTDNGCIHAGSGCP